MVIENLSFEECIKKYDSPETLFYCDPPFLKGADYSHMGIKFTKQDHIKLRDVLSRIKGKFLLSYDDREEIKDLYKGFIIEGVTRLTGINRKNIKHNYF